MRRGLFRRIFIIYAIVIVLSVVFVEVFITAAVRDSYVKTLKEGLAIQAALASRDISFSGNNLDSLCRGLKEDTGARVTVIASDGRVLGDSDRSSARMDNHLNRAEIEQAILFGVGMAIRQSDTINSELLYVARKIPKNQTEGFMRLSVPLREVDEAVNLLRMKILLAVLTIFFVMWIFSVWQTEHLRRLLGQITDFSKSLSKGDIDRRLFLGNAGEFTEIADNLSSMSEKLQATMAEGEQERNRLNVILRSVPDGLLIIDARGYITLAGASAQEFFGHRAMTGLPFAEIVRNHEFSDLMDRVRRSLMPGRTEFRIDHPEEKSLAVRVSPLFYHQQDLAGFVAIFHDITQTEKLEQVRKDFVANVSHELKTPITAIRGFADTLLEGALEDRENAARFIRSIRANSERINSLVDDLMTISRIELGVIRVDKSLINIVEVFEAVTGLFKDRISAKGLILEISGNPDQPLISADRDRLIQILTNLIDNAIKYTDAGNIAMGMDREDGRDYIFVQDTGIGVAAKYLPRLGERFFRADPGRSRAGGGTGLGLAIVKHLVRAHGWNMQIESSPGRGTKIRIYI